MRTPIIYRYSTPTRFSDLDSYNHVNFKYYFDYIINSRLFFLKERFNVGLYELAKLGVGFFITEAKIKYGRPITGITYVEVESYVSELIDDTHFKTPFKIFDKDNGKIYASGAIYFSTINTKTGKPMPMTAEILNLFYET
jgi:acyl-CoA thioesterase FadM